MSNKEGRGTNRQTTPATQGDATEGRTEHCSVNGANALQYAQDFKAQCPEEYAKLADIAMEIKRRGERASIAQVFELARVRHVSSEQVTGKPFRLSNTLRPAIARMLMEDYHDLAGAFELRRSLCDEDPAKEDDDGE